ncbi:MAG TPA: serine/threonine-protein kinase [Kiritimatiellia bacterium]|nr:serine/threonine-protein kinase [Kiritimatiellia bacterium]
MNLKLIEQQGFHLIETVDETSQTVAWKAVQRTLERTVILRILKPEAASDPAAVSHFLTIARIVSRIKSESIASIFDIVSAEGLHYVVMEHVEGPTLEELVSANGPLPVERVLRIAASLIASLEQLWESAHVVHRNLKSSTIRLAVRGVAKITDFSLAIQAGAGVNATAMDGGNIVGTPCYLSPEQAQGSHTLTTQSDMYALGVVLYHLSTGALPFENQDVVAILAAHVKQQIPPPHHLNPALPASFSWLLHRLMMKNPNNRYPDWQAVLQDIRFLLTGNRPSCVCPGEEYLSTIEAFDDNALPALAAQEGEPQIRLKPTRRTSGRLAAYQSKNIQDEHASEIRRETLIKESVCWLVLLLWLAAIFWIRAVWQVDPQRAEGAGPLPHLAQALANLPQTVDALTGQLPAPPPEASEIEPDLPAAAPATPPPPPAADSRPVAPAAEPEPAAAAAPQPVAEPALPAGIPDALAARLADALATGSPAAALRALEADPVAFQEKPRLAELLGTVPEPDALVAEYLRSQIGKPLIFERNGKQRTVIPREVQNGIIRVEANGRGIDIAISDLTADEKLRWMEPPKDGPRAVAYCLALMRSSRREEIPARAAACPPLLAPLLTEAAARAAATAQP